MAPLSSAANCLVRNEWVCPEFFSTRSSQLTDALVEHIWITVVSVLLGLVVAFPLALLARRYRKLEGVVVGTTTAIYTIPSLALFALLLPATGLSQTTVIIGLALYSLTILVRNIIEGLKSVPEDVRESALGMGYGRARQLFGVELPLALPTLMAGLRVATVSTVALTTVGSIVGYGGLGNLLIQAVDSQFRAQVLAAGLLCVLLAVAFDLLIVAVQRVLTPWSRTQTRTAA
ncbi:MAG TPA: ABC transporter permease [Nocardioides sp.]|uniref:ABC transporter permease n=1 Tax=Nocardioides sp. TaxID=35761 RepID=UPI002D7FA64D|nr:ABC transporter permease [Nocardioides sp.]HET6652569.1 ABC transporter permease [Nocardioides sp.]